MRKFLILGLLLCLFSGLASAAPKAEVFGGFQYTHFDPNFNMTGWNGAITLGGGWLGITGDFSGVYRSGLKFHTYSVGPELRANLPLAKPFVHALIGGATSSSSGFSDTGFVGMVGGGMDIGGGTIAFRVVQVDWMATHFSSTTNTKNLRAATGIVFRF